MTFSNVLTLLFSHSLMTACAAAKDNQTTLFDGTVTYCFNDLMAPLAAEGKTGLFEIDSLATRQLSEINAMLEPYGRALTRTSKGQPAWILSGVPQWKRQCRLKLPDEAKLYIHGPRKWLDPNYNRAKANALDFPGKHPSLEKYFVIEQYWFVDDRLIHVETRARINKPIPLSKPKKEKNCP